MPAAAAEAPTGSHQVLAIKKYVLTRVISQITSSRTRPIARDLQDLFLRLPLEGAEPKSQNRNARDANRGESTTAFSPRKQLLAVLFISVRIRGGPYGKSFFRDHCNHALTKNFVLSNIRFVSWGVR